jgi:hypothetical protein
MHAMVSIVMHFLRISLTSTSQAFSMMIKDAKLLTLMQNLSSTISITVNQLFLALRLVCTLQSYRPAAEQERIDHH